MSRIELLDQNLINQIAAGEVIERPVSVVKELVENALDAGATRVTIEIADGGKQLIKVSDNGCGLDAEDLAKCVVRHATSKIKTPEDLFRITTMGFRGEALPSIASVSNMQIISKPQDSAQPHACCLHLQGSAVDRVEKVSAPEGTTVIVEDLFASVPARLKFLKSAETEKSHIRDYLGKLMLSRADVAYTFVSDGETALATQGGQTIDPDLALRNAIGAVYGSRAAKSLRKVNLTLQDFAVSGYVSDPAVVTGSRSGQAFFVNNRYIVSPLLNKAVDAAVSDLVYGGKYPYAVLFIQIAYEQVDVNVHPAKREVRFAESNKVFETVRAAVRQAYHSSLTNDASRDVRQEPQGHATIDMLSLDSQFAAPELNLRYAPPPTVNAVNIPEYNEAVFPVSNAHPLRILGQANRLFIIALDGED
ncbi:MAG: DNA mismatch repair endonuclease MutL, partial [Candidatus Margulisbacteria bacterium]|nr:DNA mismatch repair endonuclease MutL [Candidatus Margulisiibacteriota bacterium]